MPRVFRTSELKLEKNRSPIPAFAWEASPKLEELVGAKYLHFDLKSLQPDGFSYPYHFHRNAEELFVVLSGEATLRTPDGFERVAEGDVLFFEEGPGGAHQLYNHSDVPFVYLDLRTEAKLDVCEYPDSGKINILPALDIFEAGSKVAYYSGEEGVRDQWPRELLR